MKKLFLGITFACVVAGSASANEMQSLENISQELVEIRQHIETLHSEINYEKESYKDQMRSYSNQKSDLDVRISRADLNIKELQRELKKLVDSRREKTQSHDELLPVLEKSIDVLRQSVATSLPFKREERIQALDDIKYRLDSKTITPNKAANQLWAYVEDELMLGKSNGIYNDTLEINGQEQLVKVLRLGKVAMFFRTHNEKYGLVIKEGGEWQQRSFDDTESVAQLERLFDSFSKNIRNGQFVTPNFLPRS